MTNPYLEHPKEEALERFLLHKSDDQELEVIETHIMACEKCVVQLEAMELQISDLKLALTAARDEQLQAAAHTKTTFWQKWFTIPQLSWAGAAVAALAVAFIVVPHSQRQSPTAEGSLSACAASDMTLTSCRGVEKTAFPMNRPLDLKLETTDIPAGPIDAELVNASGQQIWRGEGTVKNQHADLKMPKIDDAGAYFLRLYAPSAGTEHELLREYRFQVQ